MPSPAHRAEAMGHLTGPHPSIPKIDGESSDEPKNFVLQAHETLSSFRIVPPSVCREVASVTIAGHTAPCPSPLCGGALIVPSNEGLDALSFVVC
jgi:hypothetical protein